MIRSRILIIFGTVVYLAGRVEVAMILPITEIVFLIGGISYPNRVKQKEVTQQGNDGSAMIVFAKSRRATIPKGDSTPDFDRVLLAVGSFTESL